MKKETKDFIISLLLQELNAEYVQDSKDIDDIEYVQDLIKGSKDFVSNYGEWHDKYFIKEAINRLNGEAK